MRLLCPWPVHGQPWRSFSHRREDADDASLGIAAMDLLLSFKGRRREVWGRFYTELFFLDEPTAFAAGTGPASNAGAGTRNSLPKNGAKCTGIASRHMPGRWITSCTQNACEDASNGCTGAASTNCPTAHLLHSMERLSQFVATRSYSARQMVMMFACRGRAGSPSMCSPRQR